MEVVTCILDILFFRDFCNVSELLKWYGKSNMFDKPNDTNKALLISKHFKHLLKKVLRYQVVDNLIYFDQ